VKNMGDMMELNKKIKPNGKNSKPKHYYEKGDGICFMCSQRSKYMAATEYGYKVNRSFCSTECHKSHIRKNPDYYLESYGSGIFRTLNISLPKK